MSDDLLAELTLIDLSRAQRQAFAERWPAILVNAGEPDLAEEIRAELSFAEKLNRNGVA